MLAQAESRGRQATGVALCDEDDVLVWKVATSASAVLASEAFQFNVMGKITDSTLIVLGHTRNATQNNGHLDEAAHPYLMGSVVGAHNGVIDNWGDIERKHKQRWLTDSQAAFFLLDKYSDPKKALVELGGYFALSWVKKGELNLVRSRDAVLSAAYLPKWKTLFWYSTRQVLEKSLKDIGVYTDAEIWDLKPETIYRYDPTLFGDLTKAIRVECSFPLTRDRAAYKKWNAITSGKTKGRMSQGELPLSTRSLESRIESLERKLDQMSKALRATISRTESNDAEIDFLMKLLADRGLMDNCAICGEKGDNMILNHEDEMVHEECLFSIGGDVLAGER